MGLGSMQGQSPSCSFMQTLYGDEGTTALPARHHVYKLRLGILSIILGNNNVSSSMGWQRHAHITAVTPVLAGIRRTRCQVAARPSAESRCKAMPLRSERAAFLDRAPA